MKPHEWWDLLTHVLTNYDDTALNLYLVGRMRAETELVPVEPELLEPLVVTPVESHACESVEDVERLLVPANPPEQMEPDPDDWVPPRIVPRQRPGKSRWDDEEAMEIKDRYFTGETSMSALSTELGVSLETIRQMVRRETYKHLPVTEAEERYERQKLHDQRRAAAAESAYGDTVRATLR